MLEKALYKFINYYDLIIISGPLAQSVDRGANNTKIVFTFPFYVVFVHSLLKKYYSVVRLYQVVR